MNSAETVRSIQSENGNVANEVVEVEVVGAEGQTLGVGDVEMIEETLVAG